MPDPGTDRTTTTISRRIHRLLKMASAMSGLTQKEIVETAIEEYMEKRAGLDQLLKGRED